MSQELKPCPFCGGKNIILGTHEASWGTEQYIKCCDCMAKIQIDQEYGEKMLIYRWNRRVDREHGLLLLVPCSVGADIYYIPSRKNVRLNLLDGHEEENRVFHQTVDRITFAKNRWYMECDSDLEYGTGRVLLDTSYGVTWFLSSEEAETKLKEIKLEAKEKLEKM